MNHYKIRLAPQPSTREEMWKITEDGKDLEKKAMEVKINVKSYTEESNETVPDRFGRFERWYIACDGIGRWDDKTFVIT